jgi:hypothetical protein
MTGRRRVALWAASTALGLALLALGVFFVVGGLDRADKTASVVGAFVGVGGLAVSVYGVVQTRRAPTQSNGQTVRDSTVGGGSLQVRDVRGNLRIGAPPESRVQPSKRRRSPHRGTPPPVSGGQSVTNSHVEGPVRQVDGVGGDADIDQ